MQHSQNGARKRVLILELSVNGHHPTYVRRLLESEIPQFADIILASRKELFSHPEIRSFSDRFLAHEIKPAPSAAALHKDFSAASLISSSWRIGKLYRQTYRELSKTMDIEFIIVPFLDDCLLGLALPTAPFGGKPWLAVTMRAMFHFRRMGIIAPRQRLNALRQRLFSRILHQRSTVAILTIDPTLAKFAREQRKPGYGKIEYLPDPAVRHEALPSKTDARRRLNIPGQARVVLLYGEIAARKGVISLLESAADPTCSAELHVLLAGRHEHAPLMMNNPAYISLLAQHRVHRVDGFLDDDGERTVLAATDCMWVGYANFYLMSGIMVLSGRHGIPVIATSNGLIGYWTTEKNIGIAVDVSNRSCVVAALNQLVFEPELFARMGENGIEAFSEHRPAALQQLVIEKLREYGF
jgi:glycosyltransferase involved in cell wall biosynthesis